MNQYLIVNAFIKPEVATLFKSILAAFPVTSKIIYVGLGESKP